VSARSASGAAGASPAGASAAARLAALSCGAVWRWCAGGAPGGSPGPDLNNVAARKNLNETAFFFPHLVSDADGTVRITFEMPQALTKWKFLGFAHDKTLRSGFITDSVVTARSPSSIFAPECMIRIGTAWSSPASFSFSRIIRLVKWDA
jgi:hypothetical protein